MPHTTGRRVQGVGWVRSRLGGLLGY